MLWHSFADMADVIAGGELVIDRGEGVHVWDEGGRRYLDATASLWNCNVGYGRIEIADAAAAPDRAEALIAAMRARLTAVRARVAARPRPRVLTYSLGGRTSGRATTFDSVIRAAGGENVAAALGITGWKTLSPLPVPPWRKDWWPVGVWPT